MVASDLLFLRIISATLLVGLFVFVSKRLHRGDLSFTLGIVWSAAIAAAMLLTVAPSILFGIAGQFGAKVPVHFLFFVVQFFLVLLVFGLTLKSARQEKQLTRVSQELALLRLEIELQLSASRQAEQAPADTKRLANQR